MKNYVKELLKKYGLFKSSYNVQSLAKALNIHLYSVDEVFDSMMMLSANGIPVTIDNVLLGKINKAILVNRSLSYYAKNFVIANELANYLTLPRKVQESDYQHVSQSVNVRNFDHTVNPLAYELLMPYDLVKSILKKNNLSFTQTSPESVSIVAKTFSVSLDQAKVRMGFFNQIYSQEEPSKS